jgi:hypothetical protein
LIELKQRPERGMKHGKYGSKIEVMNIEEGGN